MRQLVEEGGVSLRHVSKAFGPTQVLNDIFLDIAPGEFLTLLGPSGCGKSTLLKIIAGIERQDCGSILIGTQPVNDVRPKLRDVAMVFQSYALYPHMTVEQNISLPLRMRYLGVAQRLPFFGRFLPGTGGRNAEIKREVANTARLLEIEHLLDRKPGQLSGGQRQRVALGRAMVRHPAVFLMDEPLSNLDAKLRVQMRAEIVHLHRRLGATFIYVTHDQSEAMTMSDRIAVMYDGEILQVAAPAAMYSDPADQRVAEFIGSPKINLLTSIVEERGHLSVAGVTLLVDSGLIQGQTLTIGIRPESFLLTDSAATDAIPGYVRLIEHVGSDLFIHLGVDKVTEHLIARLPVDRASSLRIGQKIGVKVRSDRVLLFDKNGRRLQLDGSDDYTSATAIRSIA